MEHDQELAGMLGSALFDTTGALLMVLDRQARIVRFNRAAQEFTGCTFDQVRDQPFFWTRFLPGACREEVVAVFEGLLEAEDFRSHENPWLDRAGEQRLFVWNNSVLRDRDGSVRYVITLGVDVTQTRRAEVLWREGETRYRNLVEHAPDAILLVDTDGCFALVNRSCVALLGVAGPEELIGQRVFDFVAPSSRARVRERVRYLREHGGVVPAAVVSMLRRDGTEVEVESVATAYVADGRTNIHVLLRDLTERRSLERQVVDAATWEQQRIGLDLHDGIGQKLTALGLLCAGLKRRLERAGRVEDAAVAEQLLDELQETIRETRSVARGLSPVQLDQSSLGAALQHLAESMARTAEAKVDVRLRGDESGLDDTAATHLYRIAQEAMNNAIKHAHARNIHVALAVQGDRATLVVRDDGVGLASGLGQGIGMSVMRHRAALIGGALELRSERGEGTTVRCTCPIRAGRP